MSERVVRNGYSKTATEKRLRTEFVGIVGLTTYDYYGDPQQTRKWKASCVTRKPSTFSSLLALLFLINGERRLEEVLFLIGIQVDRSDLEFKV